MRNAFPTAVADVTVGVNGIPPPLTYVSPEKVSGSLSLAEERDS
jgi:hypothetical protein